MYWDDSASCSAFSSRPIRAISISPFFSSSSAAFSSSSLLVRWSSTDCERSSWVSRWDWASSSSVRAFAMIVFRTTPMVPTSWSTRCRCSSEKVLNEASSMTPST